MKTLLIEPLRGRFAWMIHDGGTFVRRGLAGSLAGIQSVIDGQSSATPPVPAEPVDEVYVAREVLTAEQLSACGDYGWVAVATDARPGPPEYWDAVIPPNARR